MEFSRFVVLIFRAEQFGHIINIVNISLYDNLKKILVVVVGKKENENKEKRLLL